MNEYPSRTVFNEPKLDIKKWERDQIIGLYTDTKKRDRSGMLIKEINIDDSERFNELKEKICSYQDTLLQKNVSDHIRKRDLKKIMELEH